MPRLLRASTDFGLIDKVRRGEEIPLSVFTAGEAMVADVQPARPGGPSYWATYVAVDGAEASRDRAVRLGGKVVVPRVDVPKVGIVSVVADPSGAALGLFQAEARRG